jgi:hypothetical protein
LLPLPTLVNHKILTAPLTLDWLASPLLDQVVVYNNDALT